MSSSAAVALAIALLAASDDPVPAPSPLDGRSPAEVRARLGEPAVARAEAAGALWTYRLSRCALFVYFADGGQGLKVSGVESGPRRYGDSPPEAAACLADPSPPATGPAAPAVAPPTLPSESSAGVPPA